MKKIISLLLALSLMPFVQMSFSAFAGYEESEYEPYVQSEEFLSSLGITDTQQYDFSNAVTRSEAAAYILKMINNGVTGTSYRGLFSDVEAQTKNALIIEKLVELGIVTGYGDGSYRPDDFLSYNEARSMFLKTLGFDGLEDREAIQNKYIAEVDIFDNTQKTSGFVSLGDFFVMMRNTLHENVIGYEFAGSSKIYKVLDMSLLYAKYGIVYSEGVIVKNDITYLWSAYDVSKNSLTLELTGGGELDIYAEPMCRAYDDIGKLVRIYYTEEDEEYIHHETKSKCESVVLDISQINLQKSDIGSGNISYWHESRNAEKTLILENGCYFIYNGVIYKNHTMDLTALNNKPGYAEAIDNDGDGKYEVLKIYAYDTVIVGDISEKYEVVYDEYDSSRYFNIKESDYNRFELYNENGEQITVSDIGAGDVVSYAKSNSANGNDAIKIYVSSSRENGEITSCDMIDNTTRLALDYADGRVLADRAVNGNYVIGSNILTYLDAFGNIVYVESDYSRNTGYGLLIKTVYDEITEKAIATVYTLSDTYKVYEIADRVTIDGGSYKDRAYDAYNLLKSVSSGAAAPEIAGGVTAIRYKLNDSNQICVIDTPSTEKKEESNNILYCIDGGTYAAYRGNVLGHKIPYKADTQVISIFADDYTDKKAFAAKENLSVGVASDLIKAGQRYNVIAYNSDPQQPYADLILKLSNSSIELDTPMFVIDRVKTVYDEEQAEVVYAIDGYVKGQSQTRYIANGSNAVALKDYKRGDIVRFVADSYGYISEFSDVLKNNADSSITTATIPGSSINEESIPSITSFNGYVYSRTDNLISLNSFAAGTINKKPGDIDWSKEELMTVGIDSSTPIVIVDSDDDKIYAGNYSQIMDYELYDDNCSRVFICFRGSSIREIVVYN